MKVNQNNISTELIFEKRNAANIFNMLANFYVPDTKSG